jgi:hypothetical protein
MFAARWSSFHSVHLCGLEFGIVFLFFKSSAGTFCNCHLAIEVCISASHQKNLRPIQCRFAAWASLRRSADTFHYRLVFFLVVGRFLRSPMCIDNSPETTKRRCKSESTISRGTRGRCRSPTVPLFLFLNAIGRSFLVPLCVRNRKGETLSASEM